MSTSQRFTATLLLLCAVCGALGLTALRRSLGYPEVLTASSADSFSAVREHWLAICVGLVLCGVAAGLLVPITVGLVRLLPPGPERSALTVVAAATTGAQLTGLLFWLVSVPALARRAAIPAEADRASAVFDAARSLFGVMVGEVLACLLLAIWSVALIARAARAGVVRRCAGRASLSVPALALLAALGGLAAGGVLGGVLLPFGIDAAVTGRVVGQLIWYLWLVGLAVVVWHLEPGQPTQTGSDPWERTRAAAPTAPTPLPREGSAPSWADPARERHASAGAEDGHGGGSGSSPVADHRPDDRFFDAATEINGPITNRRAADRPALRAAPQPAGRFLGDDAPTEPGVDATFLSHGSPGNPDQPATPDTAGCPGIGGTARRGTDGSDQPAGAGDPAKDPR
ncbi:conserved membrane hypothetical protein [Frankia canadensis]|uniref:Uncharacterized protein n=1 Tax=Frankia canadensis TaxID=1836972 RepID=A0A2I2KJX8_9ACTN|nr:hypothetical protein [Frankia canadensis]SNQ45954.1 conserved membrane hypothetical protein [Frankia canadensis]SOU53244.1 conserved membrane hypothetical protein [Frankia canadensis]